MSAQRLLAMLVVVAAILVVFVTHAQEAETTSKNEVRLFPFASTSSEPRLRVTRWGRVADFYHISVKLQMSM